MTQTSQDRKERSASKYITLARGISQSLHFIKSERCSQLVFRWNAFHLGTHIHHKIFINESLLHSCLDNCLFLRSVHTHNCLSAVTEWNICGCFLHRHIFPNVRTPLSRQQELSAIPLSALSTDK